MLASPGPAPEGSPAPGSSTPDGRAEGQESRPDQRLGRSRRVTKASQFREAYAQGRRQVGRFMVLWVRTGEETALRLGVVAGRKVGDSVRRSRAKRLLREAYRRERHRFHGDVDVILVARRAVLSAGWPAVKAELLRLAERAGLVAGQEHQAKE